MRKADFLIGPRSGDESLFQRPATMTITHATFPPRQMVLDGRDQRSKFLDKPFPNVINSANYPNLPVGITEAFFPIVFGIHSSVGYGGQGVFRCIHVDTVQHRYTAAFHYIQDATVYTKTPEETEFQITPHSYTLVNEPIVINGRNFQPTYIQFAGALPDGTEVRADIEGSNFRDAWGTLAPINFVSRNPVDHNIGIISYAKLLESPTPDFSDYDLASFAEVHTKVTGMHSDYAITEPLTPNESLTQLNAPFIIHLVPDNHDRMKLVKITDADFENAPELNDFDGMLLKSEIISLAAPTYNRYRYRYAPNHTDGSFGAEETFDNTSDQEVLGEIEELQVDFHSVRDADVAAQLIAERAGWEDQDAHRIRLQLDAPTNLINVDLLKPFRLTHYGGLADGGWVNEAFITYRWRLDLDLMIFEIDAIRRVVVANPQDQLQAIGNWTLNHRAGVEYLTTARRLYECFVDTRSSASERKMVVLGSDTVGLMGPIDDGTYPALTNIIRSSDTKWHGNKLHIVTQEENTGRVGYSRLNGSAGLYEILNQTVLASNSHGDIGVTITVQNPSGLPVIMFQGDREHRTAWLARPGDGPEGDYRRAYVTVRGEDGTWSAPQMMGNPLDAFANLWFPIWGDPNYNGTVHINTGRAEAGLDNRVHFVFGRKEPGDVANTSDFCIQTLRTDGSLSQTCEFEMTVALGYSSDFLGGDPCGIEDTNGQYWVVFPVGKILEPKLCIWKDKDNPTIPDRIILLSTHQVPPATFGTQYAPIGVRAHGGKLHVIHGLRGGSADWAAYKTISQPFETSEAVPAYTSGSSADQIGPVWPVNTYSHHNFDIKTLRDGKTYIFKVTSGNFGVPDTDALSIHEKIDIAEDIPAAPDYTIADFVAEHS
jgi:hypothetical protein